MVTWLWVFETRYGFYFFSSLFPNRTDGNSSVPKLSAAHLRPALQHFDGYLSRRAQTLLRASSDGMYSKKTKDDGRVQVTGGKRLKSSGAYTPAFGRKVAKLFLKRGEHVARTG